jgi:hypothetical protein
MAHALAQAIEGLVDVKKHREISEPARNLAQPASSVEAFVERMMALFHTLKN